MLFLVLLLAVGVGGGRRGAFVLAFLVGRFVVVFVVIVVIIVVVVVFLAFVVVVFDWLLDRWLRHDVVACETRALSNCPTCALPRGGAPMMSANMSFLRSTFCRRASLTTRTASARAANKRRRRVHQPPFFALNIANSQLLQ